MVVFVPVAFGQDKRAMPDLSRATLEELMNIGSRRRRAGAARPSTRRLRSS
jgi:hypothetical protein